MKPFDLKAAQAGEPIVRFHSVNNESVPVTLVGVRLNGMIAVEYNAHSGVTSYTPDELRMAPRKLKMNIEITFRNGVIHSSWATQKDLPKQKDGHEWTYRYATIEVDAP